MRTLLVLVVAMVALAGCGHKKRARVTLRQRPPRTPVVVHPGDTEEGVASWYGHPYHGRAAANGEIYDMEKMTAAHRTLPFNTWVRVYDLDNNRTTEVRIIDRGPFIGGRIIDLSHAAARELGMIGPGTGARAHRSHQRPAGGRAGAFRGSGGRLPRPCQRRAAAQPDGGPLRHGAGCCSAPRDPTSVAGAGGRGSRREDGANRLAERIRQDSVEKTSGFVVRIDSAT